MIGRETFQRLEERLSRRPAGVLDAGTLRRAAVTIPIIEHDGEWFLLFSRRSSEMRLHKGQIAFPGGGANEGETLEAAAVREMEEEVGVPLSGVRLIGRLDDLITRTGFIVSPFVGFVVPPAQYVLQETEVVEAFEVPIRELLDPRNPEIRFLDYQGGKYPSYFYTWSDFEIWGLTGRMLKSFLDLLRTVA